MRFPWPGGRHPWLDAVVETETHVIGVESKRFEPFRDVPTPSFSDAFDRDVWREDLVAFARIKDRLRREPTLYRHLDAAQLVKHALGLATQARADGKHAALIYLYAEPDLVGTAELRLHREEIAHFAEAVSGTSLRFAACSWRAWLKRFPADAKAHADRLIATFNP